MRKNILFSLIISLGIVAAALIISCGGSSGGSSRADVSTGSVALYVTDSPEDDYKRVEITINDVYLLHTGTGTTCDILNEPIQDIDLTDLSHMLQIVDISNCDARSYNRIHIEFDQHVTLTDMNDISDTCNFTSYKGNDNNPNVLQCNGNTCVIEINGTVNVLANKNNELALDFELKDFEVTNFNLPLCSVTIKVSPLNSSDIKKKHDDGYDEGITGYITSVNASEGNFTMISESDTYIVSYNNITTQQGIDALLTLSASDHLKVKVEASSINLDTNYIEPFAVYAEVEGIVSNLDDTITKTFTFTYQTIKSITVDYKNAEVEGIPADNANVEVKLSGYDGTNYLSKEVEIED